jgi:predicted GNAT family acetyltransferase
MALVCRVPEGRVMPTGPDMKKALQQSSAMKRQKDAVKEEALRRAVADVLDGSVGSAEDAARGRGLSAELVRKAVKDARRANGGA